MRTRAEPCQAREGAKDSSTLSGLEQARESTVAADHCLAQVGAGADLSQ